MEIQRLKQAGCLELRVTGRLDSAWARQLETELAEAVRAGELHVRLDLAGVDFLSSAGIRVLLRYYSELRRIKGSFALLRSSAAVREVLELSGLKHLVESAAAPPAAKEPAQEGVRVTCGALVLQLYGARKADPLTCRLIGDPACLSGAACGAGATLALRPQVLALGLGAFGPSFEESRARVGEFLAAGGAAVYQPSDGGDTPDYLLSAGAFVPSVQVLYAAACEGELPYFFHVGPGESGAAAPLSQIVRAGFEVTGAAALALVAIAESAGLVGASLKRSPAAAGARGPLFDFPGIRQWLSFTPERAHRRSLAVVVGLAVAREQPEYAELLPFLRPLGREPWPRGHFHAAAGSFRALPHERLALAPTLGAVFGAERVQGVLHLLNDYRSPSGAGESEFVRGSVWAGPVGRVVKP